ncbi:hypothetical protein [Gynuella sp.]|uniref:hypothetical protein n=1 Tax=Gynuella sp. TaxID=2969146 RepID=UPI003D0D8EA0
MNFFIKKDMSDIFHQNVILHNKIYFSSVKKIIVLLFISSFFLGVRIYENIVIGDICLVLSVVGGFFYTKKIAYKEVFCFFLVLITFLFSGLYINSLSYFVIDLIQFSLYSFAGFIFAGLYIRGWKDNIDQMLVRYTLVVSILACMQYIILRVSGSNIFSFVSSTAGISSWVENYARATGTLQHFNQLAIVLLPGLFISLCKQKWHIYGVIVLALLASGSRVGIVSVFLLTMLAPFVNRKLLSFWKLSLALMLVLLFLVSNPDFVAKRLSLISSGSIDDSLGTRLSYIKFGIDLLQSRAYSGIGLGQLRPLYGLDNLESSLMLFCLELGFLLIPLLVITVFTFFENMLSRKDPQNLVIFFVVTIASSMQPFLHMSNVAPMFWFYLFLLYSLKIRNSAFLPKGSERRVCK